MNLPTTAETVHFVPSPPDCVRAAGAAAYAAVDKACAQGQDLLEGATLVPMTEARLDAMLVIENVAFTHPWTRGNFVDALRSGYHGEVLLSPSGEVLGYFLAMQVLDEVHLLNITVSPVHQGQGWARVLLAALRRWAVSVNAQWLWLEVRESNTRARAIYERQGYSQVGARKKYYPVHDGERETAIIMSMPL